jgi:hypothetical protein
MSIFFHTQAQQAAQAAIDEAIEQHGADNSAFLYCGFAWATIKPARGAFIAALKAKNIGSKGEYGGYRISAYDMFTLPPKLSQSMELKEIGARAYCDRLQELGINAYPGSRAD